MSTLLVTHSGSHPRDMELIREEFSDFEIRELEFPPGGLRKHAADKLISALEGCEALLLRPGMITEEVISSAPDLEVIALTGHGFDNVDVEAATEHGVTVVHCPEGPIHGVSEFVFGAVLSLLSDLPATWELVSDGEWVDARDRAVREPPFEYSTLGIVGLGHIGFRVARIASEGFGADVIGYDPYITEDREPELYFPRHDHAEVEDIGVELVDDLQTMCERSDILSLHVPLSKDTTNMIGAEELETLNDGMLINTSRGDVVNEQELAEAIRDERFTGKAVLDVLVNEPPRLDNPLLDLPNVYISPHIAGVTSPSRNTQRKSIQLVADKISNVLSGERPTSVVNPSVLE